jgi:Galactokinase galactose-binding signature
MTSVPTATSLDEIYDLEAVALQGPRWQSLLAKFKDKYGRPADFISRSPGRVNIIGEVSHPEILVQSAVFILNCIACRLLSL